MADNNDLIKEALTLANIINDRETPTARQSDYSLTLMNDMLADWHEDGIEIGYYPQTSLTDVWPCDDKYLRGVKYNLARAIAGFNGVVTPDETMRIADLTYDRLSKATVEEIETDFGHMPYGGNGPWEVDVN